MSLAAAIAAAGSLETKKKIFHFKHGEWITCADIANTGIVRRSSARRNLVQLVDAALMECDTSKNAHRYRAIKPSDTELTLSMFMDVETIHDDGRVAQRLASALSNEKRRELKESKINSLLPFLKEKMITGAEAANFMDIDLSTAYRYMDELIKAGAVTVEMKGRFKYFKHTGQVESISLAPLTQAPNTNVFKRRKRICALQKILTETPETIKEIAERAKIHHTTVNKFLVSLYLEGGCKRERVVIDKNACLKYYITKDCKEFDAGEANPNYNHSDQRDGWQYSEMPTDNPMINALMGYTEFKPPKGRVIEESMPHIPVSRPKYHVSGCTLEMV
jgi:predicted transcriptional regulator